MSAVEETWSPTSTKRTLRIFLADAAKNNSQIKQLDYIGAFLQAPVRARVFVSLPNEYAQICPEYAQFYGKPLKLIKSCYGMIFSNKWWFIVLQEYLISEEAGFKRSECDNALFIKKEEDGSYTKMLVYIDDSLYYNTGENINIIKQLERNLENKFKVQFQGNAHWFLSMRITRDVHGNYLLDQSRHSKNLVKKHLGGISGSKITNRPLPSDFIETKKDCSESDSDVEQLSTEYRIDYPSVIGSLIYLLNTRPDITFAVTKLAKFMRTPGRNHFKALVHLLHYVNDNSNYGLKFYRKVEDSPIYKILRKVKIDPIHDIFGIHDSSWQDCPDTGRSTGSYLLMKQGGVVDFNTFVPAPVAMSSAEAECNAGAVAGMAMCHIRMLNNDINGFEADIIPTPPILMLCDSQSAVIIANSDKDIKSLRHCKRRLLYMRQLRIEEEQRFQHISNEYMLADGGTKNLDVGSIKDINKYILAETDP